MKRFYSFLLLLAATVLTATVRAQVINGDLNHNQGLDVEDVTLLIDGYLTGETEVYTPRIDFYQEDNSLVVGTWYRSKTDFLTLNADGTTNYGNGYTYCFLPSQGCILFFNAARTPVTYIKVIYFNSNSLGKYMATKFPGKDDLTILYAEPFQLVESITLSHTSLNLQLDSDPVRLTATVEPSNADNTSVEWMSSNEEVATVYSRGTVEAVGEGTAVITCMAADGSGVTATCEVTVNGTPPAPEHEYVDLGLSVKWATMNIGANAPEEYGDYFAWGETEPRLDVYPYRYKWMENFSLTKYCTISNDGIVDNKTILELSDDAAHANWGGTWRMPTLDECMELKNNCTFEWTTQNGVKGRRVTGPNGNSIFLPAAGCLWGSIFAETDENGVYRAGELGEYWSSSLRLNYDHDAWYLSSGIDSNSRSQGRPVRAVCP